MGQNGGKLWQPKPLEKSAEDRSTGTQLTSAAVVVPQLCLQSIMHFSTVSGSKSQSPTVGAKVPYNLTLCLGVSYMHSYIKKSHI